jgi:uncharacterized protein (TIGR02246 family)
MKTWLNSLLLTIAVVAPTFAADDLSTAVKRLNDQWLAAYNKDDAAGLTKLYTSDATLVPPDVEKPINGSQGIQSYFEGMLKQKLSNAAIPVIDVKQLDSKTVYVTGSWSGVAGQQKIGGLWVNILTQEGSDWKIRLDTWNMPPPPATATGSTQPPATKQ